VFTARYALSPYIKQIRFVFKGLTLRNCTFCPQSAFMRHALFSKQTAITSVQNINSLGFITERICVYRTVWTGSLNTIQVNVILYRVKWIFAFHERSIHVQFLKCSFTYIRHEYHIILLTSLGNVPRNLPWKRLQNSSLSDWRGMLHGRLPACNTQEPYKLPIIKAMHNHRTRNSIYWSRNSVRKILPCILI
jgi:hypothetical protein